MLAFHERISVILSEAKDLKIASTIEILRFAQNDEKIIHHRDSSLRSE
jgi:hypothetical protein